MSKKAKSFEFIFPVTDFRTKPATHVGDLTVYAIVYQFPDGTLHKDGDETTVDLDNVLWNGVSVGLLLDACAEDLHDQIIEAARQHGIERFEITPAEPELENGAEEAQESEDWVNDQAEQELMSHEN